MKDSTKKFYAPLIMVALLCVVVLSGQQAKRLRQDHDDTKSPPGKVLSLKAPGCVATAPDGKPFGLPASGAASSVLIPKSTKFSDECFVTVKRTELERQGNNE